MEDSHWIVSDGTRRNVEPGPTSIGSSILTDQQEMLFYDKLLVKIVARKLRTTSNKILSYYLFEDTKFQNFLLG